MYMLYSKNSLALIEIDPDTCGKDNTYAMQRKLWVAKLATVKREFWAPSDVLQWESAVAMSVRGT